MTVFILFVIILTGWFSVTDLPVALAPAGTCHTVARRFRVPGIMLLLFVGVGLSRLEVPQLFPDKDYSVVIFAATLAVVAVRIFIKDASIVFSLAGSDSRDADAPKRFVGYQVVGAAFVAGRCHIHNPYRHHSLQGNLCDFVKV